MKVTPDRAAIFAIFRAFSLDMCRDRRGHCRNKPVNIAIVTSLGLDLQILSVGRIRMDRYVEAHDENRPNQPNRGTFRVEEERRKRRHGDACGCWLQGIEEEWLLSCSGLRKICRHQKASNKRAQGHQSLY